MSSEIQIQIKEQVEQYPVLLYMKGTADMPQCGFSAMVVKILKEYGQPFATVDVLADEGVRQGIKDFSNWPTIPQLYINGKFVGGCDIVTEMHQAGELDVLLNAAKKVGDS